MQLGSRLVCIALVSLLVAPAMAQKPRQGNAAKGKGRINNPLLKATQGLELSDEQKTKVAALAKEYSETMTALREQGFSQQLNQKKNEAMKKAREAGKKGKELQAETFASLDATDEQKTLLKQAGETQSKLQKGIAAVLTKEQIEQLPPQAKQALTRAMPKAKSGKDAGKAKKNAS